MRRDRPHRSAAQVAHTTTAKRVRRRRRFRFRRGRRSTSTHCQHAPESAILKMPATRVLAGLRIRHDDFGIYQGNRRYADIVAGHASNAQDARIFAI
ncbi:hypothetical protein A8F72_10955 [Burkholderia cenocepacia]|nr:hypothetical protein A8F32_17400 [Burkholderia cenocepacia]ONI98308.1 hypothetical protein A8F33_37460 [Burkholderia cenocepacia]ONJ02827.1 hypothetical protein A8F53_20705 [Burkholderia cenocepacia]ONJ35053.1 hypothetical protein A8F38_11705 [Burkholderia cenocepacia]ONY68630.1 hypothetical protein A8F35_24375 [Burkholderia cenocepacia]